MPCSWRLSMASEGGVSGRVHRDDAGECGFSSLDVLRLGGSPGGGLRGGGSRDGVRCGTVLRLDAIDLDSDFKKAFGIHLNMAEIESTSSPSSKRTHRAVASVS